MFSHKTPHPPIIIHLELSGLDKKKKKKKKIQQEFFFHSLFYDEYQASLKLPTLSLVHLGFD